MVQAAVLQADLVHLAARLVHGLLHGHRHFTGLPLAHADGTIAIADHGQGGKAEDAATFHHLGDAVDRDHLLAQAVVALFGGRLLFPALRFSHVESRLKLEAACAGITS